MTSPNSPAPPPRDEPTSGDVEKRRVRVIGEPEKTPVFNCEALVGRLPGQAQYAARAANLPGVQGLGGSEREALQQLVAEFKREVAACVAGGNEIPWIDPPHKPHPNEQVRLLAVHL